MVNNESDEILSNNDEIDNFNIYEWLLFFWSNKFSFIKIVAVSLILGVIVALLAPKKYTAVATILPPQSSTQSSMLSQISQFVGDFSTGQTDINKLFPDIATCRTILMEVLNAKYNEVSFLDILVKSHKNKKKKDIDERILHENAFELLKSFIGTNIAVRTSLVTIKVTYHDPEIAAALVNEILNQMDIFLRFRIKTFATSQSQMIENRLNVISDSLRIAEDNLLQFRESNRTTNLSPTLQIFEMRLLREVEVNNAVYVELSRQLEVSKIQEIQLRPVLNILDKATPPIRRSGPYRKKIVVIFMITGFFLNLGYIKIIPSITEYIKKFDNNDTGIKNIINI